MPWPFCPLPHHQSCPLRPASAGQCLLYCTSTLFLRVVARDQEGQMSTLQPVPGRVEVNSNVLTHEPPLASSNYTPWTKLGSHATVCLSICLQYESEDVIGCPRHMAPCRFLLGNSFPPPAAWAGWGFSQVTCFQGLEPQLPPLINDQIEQVALGPSQ